MKETKTVQVYPDDTIINLTIEEYESFGWEVIGNQRCQEYDRQTYDSDGSLTNHYSTFNKITFTREKSSPWYDKVTQYENEYNSLESTINKYRNRKPDFYPPKKVTGGSIALCVLGYFMYVLPGIIITIVLSVRSSRYKKYVKDYDRRISDYENEYPEKIKQLQAQKYELRACAERLILGKA